MYLRIGGLDVGQGAIGYGVSSIDFGQPGAEDRTFACTLRIRGTSESDYRNKRAALAVELTRSEITIVARTANGTAESAISLRAHGRFPWQEPYAVLTEVRYAADVQITLKVDPWTRHANRVFLASPFGSVFPSDATVIRNSAQRVYARDGRYCIVSDTTDTGTLQLAFAGVANEDLVIEFDWEVEAINSGNGVSFNAILPDSSAVILVAGAAISRGHFRGTITMPSTGTGYIYVRPYYATGTTTAYVSKVEVGIKQLVVGPKTPSLPIASTWPSTFVRTGSRINYLLNPGLELDTNSDGKADNFVVGGVVGTPVCTGVTALAGSAGSRAQRVQYTGVAGDSGTQSLFALADLTEVGSFAPAEVATISVIAKGAFTGCSPYLSISAYDAAGTWIAGSSLAISLTSTATRFSHAYTLPAGTSRIRAGISSGSEIGNGDTVDLYMDDMQLTKTSVAVTYFDGDTAGAAWSGTAHASTSTFYFCHAVASALHVEADALTNGYCQAKVGTVIPERRYGVGYALAVPTYGGGVYIGATLNFRDAGGTVVSAVAVPVPGAGVAGNAWYQADGITPLTAATADLELAWSGGTASGPCAAVFTQIQFGEQVIRAPGTIHLDSLVTEAPAPLEIPAALGYSVDAHLAALAVAPADGQSYLIESETLVTTPGGGTIWGGDLPGASFSGGHARYNVLGAGLWDEGFFDTSRFRPGRYRLFVKAYDTTGALASIYCPWTGVTRTTTLQVATWLDLGTISLPVGRTRMGTSAWANIQMKSAGSGVVCDCLYLMPLPALIYHPSSADPDTLTATDTTTLEIDKDGVVFVDSVADMSYVTPPGKLEATALDVLHVLVDRNSSGVEATHNSVVPIYAVPQFSLWPAAA